MTNEQKSFPVRYMVLKAWYGYKVVDACSPKLKTVKRFIGGYFEPFVILVDAHRYARRKNEAEGYVYRPE
jgi:hypothetical protein